MKNTNKAKKVSQEQTLSLFDAEKFYNKFKSDLIKAFNLSDDEANKQAEMIADRFQMAFQN